MVEKVPPVLIFSVPFGSVVTVVFHSTSLRGSQFESRFKFRSSKTARLLRRALPPTRPSAPFASWVHSTSRNFGKSKPPYSSGWAEAHERREAPDGSPGR